MIRRLQALGQQNDTESPRLTIPPWDMVRGEGLPPGAVPIPQVSGLAADGSEQEAFTEAIIRQRVGPGQCYTALSNVMGEFDPNVTYKGRNHHMTFIDSLNSPEAKKGLPRFKSIDFRFASDPVEALESLSKLMPLLVGYKPGVAGSNPKWGHSAVLPKGKNQEYYGLGPQNPMMDRLTRKELEQALRTGDIVVGFMTQLDTPSVA